MIEKEKINLDDPAVYKLYDAEGMLDHVHNFPSLCEKAWRMTMDFKLPSYNGGIKNVVILGMGGSAIGGDLVGSLASSESRIPVSVCRGYDLPPYVDAGTLVIASSYSGATEETLSAFQQAIATPAKKLAVTTGGKLKDLCDSKGIPVFAIDYQTQPRAALPFSFFMILGLLQKLGILSDKTGEVKETIVNLNGLAVKINEKVASSQNMAKRLASMLYGRLAVIYGAGITAEAAHRWKTQINENSKSMAFYEILPELDHNAIVG
jgi:glucose/mannose-6-phosphate isomerase